MRNMEGTLDSEKLKKARRQNFGSFMVGNLISGFGETCFQIAYIPFVYVVTNYNLFLTGILTTFTIMWAFIPAPFSGKLSDRFGRKRMLILSIPISALGVFLLYFSVVAKHCHANEKTKKTFVSIKKV